MEIGESLASIKQFQTSLRTYTTIVLCVAVLLSLLTDFLFTGFLLRPLSSIINKRLENVNDPSHFNYEMIKTSTTDFQHLDNQLKDMLKRISHSFFTQKEFIANVSHELLTPISILKTRFENLLNEEDINEEMQNQIYSSLNTLHWLKNIVNSLLLISKIENEQFEQNEEIDLDKLLEKIYEDVEHRLEEKSIRVQLNLQHQYHFYGNASLIRTMLFNVITNAIKYNKQEGTITITDDFENGHYQLTISDTGIGIDPKKLKVIFNRFEKLDSTSENSHGLGLSIVQSVANFHKIKIDINSVSQVGTSFIFHFPS
ncbi:Alkaline phosphatase synthesis sensor protein PhoR [compost metagenome]